MKQREQWHISKETITCIKCKKTYTPDNNCISTKNPNYYYKTCSNCRGKMKDYIDSKTHLHYSNYQPSLFQ
jgi:NAD-dependent SIR2 family protein deacetylase